MYHHWDLNFYPRNVAIQLLLERIHPTIRFHCAITEADTRGFSFPFFFFLAPCLLSFHDVLTRRKRYSLKTCESSLWMLETNEEFLKDVSSELCQSFVRFFFSFFLFLESIQVSSTKDHSNRQWCFFFLEAEKVWNFFHRIYSSIKVSFYNRGV